MSRESKQYAVTMSKMYDKLINKIDEKIDESEEVVRTSCDHVAQDEKKRIERLETLKGKVSARKKKCQKGIVTG